jgi:O-antigen/teichoic acid export membrane protein
MDSKYARDAVWNYGSFLIQAISGVVINGSILLFLNAEALGVFNQIYAIYAIAGQLFVCGIHDSILKHAAEYSPDEKDRNTDSLALLNTVCVAAVACAMCLGFFGVLIFGLLCGPIGMVFDSRYVSAGIFYLVPGLFFFVINKTLIYMLNGRREMRCFALASGFRAVAIAILVGIIIFFYPSFDNFGLAFTIAEILVFILLLSWKPLSFNLYGSLFKLWFIRHLQFGLKALIHSLVSEAFIRVDILMLGIFMADSVVGIYSFAAFFIEGIYQVPVVVRNLNNPILVKLLLERNVVRFVTFARKTSLLSFSITAVIASAVGVIYPWLDSVFDPMVIQQSTVVLWVLLSGMVIYSIFVPFEFSFIAAGMPGVQSLFMFINLITNVFLNAIMIPHFGLLGACTATVISFLFSGVMLNLLCARVLLLPRGLFFK